MNKLKVSVILLCYNNFKFINQALTSVLNQTYENIELIVSDDGSDFFDYDAIRNFIEKHKKNCISEYIINHNDMNMGTVAHIEKMVSISSGDLITVIAADDAYADKYAIEMLVKEYQKYNGKARVITSLLAMCDRKLKKIKNIFTSKEDVELINSGDTKKLYEELSYRCIMPSSGTIIERSVYRDIGSLSGKYDLVEDWSSHVIIAREGIPVRCLNRLTVLHRDGGVSHGNNDGHVKVYLRYYHDLLKIYDNEVAPYEKLMSEKAAKRAAVYNEGRRKRYRNDKIEAERAGYSKIVFYFRKGVIAQGDFSLYYRIAAYIAENYKYRVYCINNSNPELQKKYLNSSIIFCNITSENLNNFNDAVFITAYNQLFFLLEEIHTLKNARILLLFLHPQLIKWMKLQTFRGFYNERKALNYIIKKNAYGFMDEANKLAAEAVVGEKLPARFFPVVAEKFTNCPITEKESDNLKKDELNIAWLGRLDKDKIFSLINFTDNVCAYFNNLKINLHLIGDGNGLGVLSKEAVNYSNVTFIYNSFIYGEKRDAYLKKNVDLVVAMGISALDSALLGLPTVLPIVSSSRFRDDKFLYIYETTNYCLGFSEKDFLNTEYARKSIKVIIEDIYFKGQKKEIGQKCYNYVIDEFSIENHVDEMLSLINGTKLTVKDCYRCGEFRRQFLLFLFYRKLCSGRSYGDFIKFRNKVSELKGMPFNKKVNKIFSKILRMMRRNKK